MRNRFRAAIAAAAVTVSAATVAVMVPQAAAADAETVCAQSRYVREHAQGVAIGTLFKGDHFDVERYSPSRQYVYGHAYGNVHQDGWVQNGWFC